MALKDILTDLGDAIREKQGGATAAEGGTKMTLAEMAEAVRYLSISDGGTVAMTVFDDMEINDTSYPSKYTLEGAYFQSGCMFIAAGAFGECLTLRVVSGTASTDANLMVIEANAFRSCIALESVYLPRAASACGFCAFADCSALKMVNLPLLTETGNLTFSNCCLLETADIPLLKVMGMGTFSDCRSLRRVKFPACETVGQMAFTHCTLLKTVDLPACTQIQGTALVRTFDCCYNLEALILRNTAAVCTAESGVLTYADNAYVYVPSALKSAYETATGWSDYAGRIRAIEDYPDVCGA